MTKYVLYDLSNGDALLPTYIWVFDDHVRAWDKFQKHYHNSTLSRLSSPIMKDSRFLKLYKRPGKNGGHPAYWTRRKGHK